LPPAQAAAHEYLAAAGAAPEPVAQGIALLGYVVLGPVGLLLVAEAVRASATLPGGHEVKTVAQSQWHRIQLQARRARAALRGSSACRSTCHFKGGSWHALTPRPCLATLNRSKPSWTL
jgi:hypothetical protein